KEGRVQIEVHYGVELWRAVENAGASPNDRTITSQRPISKREARRKVVVIEAVEPSSYVGLGKQLAGRDVQVPRQTTAILNWHIRFVTQSKVDRQVRRGLP